MKSPCLLDAVVLKTCGTLSVIPAVAMATDFLSSDRVGTEYVEGSGFIMRFGGGRAL